MTAKLQQDEARPGVVGQVGRPALSLRCRIVELADRLAGDD